MDTAAFATANSVEGALDAIADRENEGALEGFHAWKEQLESRTGVSFGIDDQVQFLNTNSERSPSNALGNVLRFY